MRRTKIVATLGPTSSSDEMLRSLITAGVDVFRLNFSHDTHDSHRERIAKIRAAGKKAGRTPAILQDLCGPKIRVEKMENGCIQLEAGKEISIVTEDVIGTTERFSTCYDALTGDVTPGKRILLNDGALELEVIDAQPEEVRCRIIRGGPLKDRKGMNLPGTPISAPSVTEKDLADLEIGIAEGVDFVALSFVRHPDDIAIVRDKLRAAECDARIIAKIEKPEAIKHIDAIISAADGIMVARGDLGVEMDIEKVTVLQKGLIKKANDMDKVVITATQMLESMTHSSMPTRAEVSDVANAIVDGTDAVMLSGETAAGEYPLEAVQMMTRIAAETELYLKDNCSHWNWGTVNPDHPVQDAIGHAALQLYRDLDAKTIAAFSRTGDTALFLSKSRPFAPIIVFTADERSLRRMRLFWGIEPVLTKAVKSREDLRKCTREYIREHQLAEPDSHILLIGGTHFGQVGTTDAIEIATAGESNLTISMRLKK